MNEFRVRVWVCGSSLREATWPDDDLCIASEQVHELGDRANTGPGGGGRSEKSRGEPARPGDSDFKLIGQADN